MEETLKMTESLCKSGQHVAGEEEKGMVWFGFLIVHRWYFFLTLNKLEFGDDLDF